MYFIAGQLEVPWLIDFTLYTFFIFFAENDGCDDDGHNIMGYYYQNMVIIGMWIVGRPPSQQRGIV